MFVPRNKLLIITSTIGVVGAFFIFLVIQNQSASAESGIKFSLPDLYSSETVHSEEWNGQLVYLDVWATWCKPCIEILPQIQMLSKEYEAQPILFMGINQDTNADTAITFLKSHQIDFNQLHDPLGEALIQLELKGIPSSILLDQTGRIMYINEGTTAESVVSLKAEIDRLLSGTR